MKLKKMFSILSISTLLWTAGMLATVYANPAGAWKQDNKGTWYQYSNGTYPKSSWLQIDGIWYHFDDIGYMSVSKWIYTNGWYYVGADGKMLVNTKTPDGYYVNETGLWIENTAQNTTTNQAAKSATVHWYDHQTVNHSNIPIEIASELTSRYRAGYGTGDQEVDGKWYFVSEEGHIAFDGWWNGYHYGVDGTWDGQPTKTQEQQLAEIDGKEEMSERTKRREELDTEIIKEELMRIINEHRENLGLDEFDISHSELQEVANLRAEELNIKFSHVRPNGEYAFSAFNDYDNLKRRHLLRYKAEILTTAYGLSEGDVAQSAFKAWKVSKGHRKIMEVNEECYANVGVVYDESNGLFNCALLAIGK